MTGMTDPMNSLNLLQQAIEQNLVSFQQGDVSPDIAVHYDTPNGTPRFTYALFNGNSVQSIALFVLTKQVEGIPCFQMGWATTENMRSKGLASQVVNKGLAELQQGMKRNSINRFYIEAVIDKSNSASIKIAEKLFPSSPTPCTDSFSGVSALQFLKVIQ